MSNSKTEEVVSELLKTPKGMIQNIIMENYKLRQELHNIKKKIIDIAKNDVFACVEELIKERSSEFLPEYIEIIFFKDCTGGCCANPLEEWSPSICCYEYKDLRINKVIDLYFGDSDIDCDVVNSIKEMCIYLTEEVGINFYVYEKEEFK